MPANKKPSQPAAAQAVGPAQPAQAAAVAPAAVAPIGQAGAPPAAASPGPVGSPPTAATLDPVDAAIDDAHKALQDLPDSIRSSQYQHTFWIDPKHWVRHRPPDWVFALQWTEYRYSEVTDKAKLEAILTSTDPGIYLFTVRPKDLIDTLFPSYAFYVGISNEKGTNRPLRDRLCDYFPTRISTIRKRKNIHKLLRLYYESTWVRCAYVPRSSAEIVDAEEKLHGYLAPPAAERDYPTDMKPLKPAF